MINIILLNNNFYYSSVSNNITISDDIFKKPYENHGTSNTNLED